MEPERIGRILGVGVRVAAKTIRERAAAASAAAAVSSSAPQQSATSRTAGAGVAEAPRTSPPAAGTARVAGSAGPAPAGGFFADGLRRLARGAGRFVGALLRPFAVASGLLMLQVSGVFFGIFALFFLVHAGQTLHATGWRDRHAEVYAGLGLLFTWFTVSSFWRANRKERRR